MASLYNKRGIWHIAYIVEGKRIVKNTFLKATTSTKKEAVKLKRDIENLISSERFIPSGNSLSSMITKFQNEHMSLKSVSHQGLFKICMSHFYKVVSPNTNVDKIDSAQIAEFINYLSSEVSNATLLTYMSYLKMLFNFLLEEDLIAKNPIKKKQIPVRVKKNIIYYGDELLVSIFDLAKERDEKYYAYLKMLLLTGQRPNDILCLRKKHIKLAEEYITIAVSKTKTQINFPIYKELKTFLTKEMKFINELDDEALIFGEFNSEKVEKRFQRIKKKLNLTGEPNTYTLKTFRKTFASNLASKGMGDSQIANLLSHENPKTTRKYYSAVSTERLRKDIDDALKK